MISYLVLDGLMQIVSLHMYCHVFLNEFKIAYLDSVFCRSSRLRTSNPLSVNPTKGSNTLKQLPTNCLSLFDHFMGLVLKGLRIHRLNLIFIITEYIFYNFVSSQTSETDYLYFYLKLETATSQFL